MIEVKSWGPETSLETREMVLYGLRELRRLGTGLLTEAVNQVDASLSAAGLASFFHGWNPSIYPPFGRIILQTCDRVEIWEGDGRARPEAARRLFELAAGLGSPFLGENAILGQIKASYEAARLDLANPTTPGWPIKACPECIQRAGLEEETWQPTALRQKTRSPGFLGTGLHRLFQAALACGKAVRTRTKLNHGAIGHGQAAAGLLTQKTNLHGQDIVIVGSNTVTSDLLNWLILRGARRISLVNRDPSKANKLLERVYQAELPQKQANLSLDVAGFADLSALAGKADILISATSAPHFVLHQGIHKPKPGAIWLDLAVPRDIDPELARHNPMELLDIQDLEAAVQDSLEDRRAEIPAARAVVQEHLDRYASWWDRHPSTNKQIQGGRHGSVAHSLSV